MDEVFAALQMNDFRDVLGAKMSTGMRQKVSIARAIVHDPPVLIFDEPTAGLDVLVARSVMKNIERLRDLGKCVLFSTHIMREVERLCDRVAVVSKGCVQACGTLAELRKALPRGRSGGVVLWAGGLSAAPLQTATGGTAFLSRAARGRFH